jgi:hypothetical protein
MSKHNMRRQLTQNQKGQMSQDPRAGRRHETLGRDGRPAVAERAPAHDRQGRTAVESFGHKNDPDELS